MTESLPQLIRRRRKELNISNVSALYRRLPNDDVDRITYETVRKLANGEQRSTKDPRVPRDLAIILGVPETTVRRALHVAPDYGEWVLPPRAQGLNPKERDTVERVIDAILSAHREGETDAHTAEAQKKTPTSDHPVATITPLPTRRPDPRYDPAIHAPYAASTGKTMSDYEAEEWSAEAGDYDPNPDGIDPA